MEVKLYSTHCPKCNVLTKKLQNKNIPFEEITDIDIIISKGYLTVPLLEVDGHIMNFNEANDWISTQED